MNDDDLEHHLRRLPAPPLPDSWRRVVLATARERAKGVSRQQEIWPMFLIQLRKTFARHPLSSGALAALWLLIFLFRATTPIDPAEKLMAGLNPGRTLYVTTLPEEIRLALLVQHEEEPTQERLRP